MNALLDHSSLRWWFTCHYSGAWRVLISWGSEYAKWIWLHVPHVGVARVARFHLAFDLGTISGICTLHNSVSKIWAPCHMYFDVERENLTTGPVVVWKWGVKKWNLIRKLNIPWKFIPRSSQYSSSTWVAVQSCTQMTSARIFTWNGEIHGNGIIDVSTIVPHTKTAFSHGLKPTLMVSANTQHIHSFRLLNVYSWNGCWIEWVSGWEATMDNVKTISRCLFFDTMPCHRPKEPVLQEDKDLKVTHEHLKPSRYVWNSTVRLWKTNTYNCEINAWVSHEELVEFP